MASGRGRTREGIDFVFDTCARAYTVRTRESAMYMLTKKVLLMWWEVLRPLRIVLGIVSKFAGGLFVLVVPFFLVTWVACGGDCITGAREACSAPLWVQTSVAMCWVIWIFSCIVAFMKYDSGTWPNFDRID